MAKIKSSNVKSFYIISNDYSISKKVAQDIKQSLISQKYCFNSKQHNFLFVVGGDGTFVRCLRQYYNTSVKIICINTGTVGFYARFKHDNWKDLVSIINDEHNFFHPKNLEISINNKNKFNAMNEIVIQSLNTIKMDVWIDKILYENYKGSGVLIATQGGATGQAKVNGGSIIMPNVNAYEFLELAPTIHAKHLTMMAPLILNGNSQIELNNFFSSQRCDLIIDGMRVTAIKSKDHVSIKQVDASFKLCFSQKVTDYIERLQQTFIKG